MITHLRRMTLIGTTSGGVSRAECCTILQFISNARPAFASGGRRLTPGLLKMSAGRASRTMERKALSSRRRKTPAQGESQELRWLPTLMAGPLPTSRIRLSAISAMIMSSISFPWCAWEKLRRPAGVREDPSDTTGMAAPVRWGNC